MARYDFRTPRLFVDARLQSGAQVPLAREAANYLGNVLRLKAGDAVLLFNGKDGEWRATLTADGKRSLGAAVEAEARPQPSAGDLHYLFAPLKHARLDYVVQKAVELGASRLQPVITRHTQVARVNTERMKANVIEAAQQCGVLAIPDVAEPVELLPLLQRFNPARTMVFCDEGADIADPVAALAKVKSPPSALLPVDAPPETTPLAVLIGPEGGFAQDERAAVLKLKNVVRLALGPRVLRADTAAVAALALVQAVLGDWTAPRQNAANTAD